MELGVKTWMAHLSKEYLTDFISLGGAAVKFALVPAGTDYGPLWTEVRNEADLQNYAFARVDSAVTRLYMMHKFFYEIARQVDWDALARAFLRRLFQQKGYAVKNPEDLTLARVAAIYNREVDFLRRDVQSWLEEEIFRDYAMAQEYRIAMMHFCLAELGADDRYRSLGPVLQEWLRGDLQHISSLKGALIFDKIQRYNARAMLHSLAHWVRRCDRKGLVLGLDLSRCFVTRKEDPSGDGIYYSKAALLDAYELLRQFIDSTDDLEGVLILVLAPTSLVSDPKRGLDTYDALRLRILDEVHDVVRSNPLGALVRLSAEDRAPL
jgi:hypothetical protein